MNRHLFVALMTYAVWMGLNAGTLHPGIAHALAAVAAVLSTTCRRPNVSLSRVACCYCRAVSSEAGGKSSSQHGCHECQIAVHHAGTVVRCWFIPDDSIWLRGWLNGMSYYRECRFVYGCVLYRNPFQGTKVSRRVCSWEQKCQGVKVQGAKVSTLFREFWSRNEECSARGTAFAAEN